MRVVVIGATGRTGEPLMCALARDPRVTSLMGVARRRPALRLPDTSWHRADIATDDLDTVVRDADAVVHLAWIVAPARRPELPWRVNVEGTARLLDAVARAGVPTLLYASSVGAYSPGPEAERVDESWPTHGVARSEHSREKAYVERLLDAFEEQHPHTRVARLRPGLLFRGRAASPGERTLGGRVPDAWPRPRHLPLLPVVDGVALQTVHVRDLVEAYQLALHDERARGAFNLAAEPPMTMEGVARLLGARPVQVPGHRVRGAMRAAWASRLRPADPGGWELAAQVPMLSTRRARTVLGWRPRHTTQDTLLELLEGIADRAGTASPPLGPDAEAGRGHELRTLPGPRDR